MSEPDPSLAPPAGTPSPPGVPAGPGASPAIPPARVPRTILAAGAVGLVVGGIGLAEVASRAVTAPTSMRVAGVFHLSMLAFLTTSVLGALHQFSPVIGMAPLRSVRVAGVSAALFVPSVWVLAGSLEWGVLWLAATAGALAWTAILLMVWNLSRPLAGRGKGTPIVGIRLSLAFLVTTAGFGVVYALDLDTGWFSLLPVRILAHAHLGLLGWLGITYMAVAEKLWPMFLLAHVERSPARWGIWLAATGVTLLVGGLLLQWRWLCVLGGLGVAAGLACHLGALAAYVRNRRRPLELLHAFIFASALSLLVAVAAGVVGALAPVTVTARQRLLTVEVLGLFGWLGLAVVGHAHKIVPFISWTKLRERGFLMRPDGKPLLFADLFDGRVARLTLASMTLGVGFLLAGAAAATSWAFAAGGLLLSLTGVLALSNLGFGPRRAGRSATVLDIPALATPVTAQEER